MAAPWAKRFYRSRPWRETRAAYAEKVNWLCEECAEPGEIVHHDKVWLRPSNINDVNVTLGEWNLKMLCRDCHARAHGRGRIVTREGFFFDEEGNLQFSSPE